MGNQDVGSAEWLFHHYKTKLVDTKKWDKITLFRHIMYAFVDDLAEHYGIAEGSFDISERVSQVEGYNKVKSIFEIRLPNMKTILLMENGEYVYCRSELIEEGVTWNGDDEWFQSFSTKYHFVKKFDNVLCELLPKIQKDPDKTVTIENMEAIAVCIVNDCQDIVNSW